VDLKQCTSCLEIKSLSMFTARNDRSGRLRPYCKTCGNNIGRARYTVHRRTSPFKLRATRARVRARRLGVAYNLTPEYLESIWTGFCPVTAAPIFLYERERQDEYCAELDRFIPSLGYIIGNVHFMSRRINRLKNNATSEELFKLANWMKTIEDSRN